MAIDVGGTVETFPFFRALIGGGLIWLGLNISIIVTDGPVD